MPTRHSHFLRPACQSIKTTRTALSPRAEPVRLGLLALTGAVAGLASGLLGVGGGAIVTPAMALFMPLSHAAIVGTSLVCTTA
eukprot:1194184-Prorocentrum_minimum.AAC.3